MSWPQRALSKHEDDLEEGEAPEALTSAIRPTPGKSCGSSLHAPCEILDFSQRRPAVWACSAPRRPFANAKGGPLRERPPIPFRKGIQRLGTWQKPHNSRGFIDPEIDPEIAGSDTACQVQQQARSLPVPLETEVGGRQGSCEDPSYVCMRLGWPGRNAPLPGAAEATGPRIKGSPRPQ